MYIEFLELDDQRVSAPVALRQVEVGQIVATLVFGVSGERADHKPHRIHSCSTVLKVRGVSELRVKDPGVLRQLNLFGRKIVGAPTIRQVDWTCVPIPGQRVNGLARASVVMRAGYDGRLKISRPLGTQFLEVPPEMEGFYHRRGGSEVIRNQFGAKTFGRLFFEYGELVEARIDRSDPVIQTSGFSDADLRTAQQELLSV